jgi:predicted metal-binding membrane protein
MTATEMAAMPMPGNAASFLGMWMVMMVPMMLPSLAPVLWRSRQSGGLTALMGLGYYSVWTALGVAAFMLMQVPAVARAAPLAGGVTVLIAGALQFTAWKAHHLACCRSAACECSPGNEAKAALRHGLRLGLHCSCCCAGSTAILLVSGLMDLRTMALATAAITAERLAPSGVRVARLIGVVVVAAGLYLVTRAV